MPKRFAYCIGGCRTTPPYLHYLKTNDADCFPVFFDHLGPDGSLYLPNSTTNTGRNAAFAEARKGNYEYVIIMDDDIEFPGMSYADGFRRFEALLDEFRPAIASPRYGWHLRGVNKQSQLDLMKRVQGLNASDALMNAFHRDVWDLVLPYWTEADEESWWNAAHVVHRVANMLMPGCFIQFNELEIKNLVSESYPREGRCEAADALMEEMTLPQWRPHLRRHEDPVDFHELHPVLRDSYKLSRAEVGRYFDLNHSYWRERFPDSLDVPKPDRLSMEPLQCQ